MQTARRFLVTVLVPALIISIFAVGAAAAHGSDGKVNICHWASNKFVKISVSLSAKPAHMKHGDVDPDEYGECDGHHGGNHEGNHGGHNGNGGGGCQGSRHKSSQVVHAWRPSGNGGGGGQHSTSHGDKS